MVPLRYKRDSRYEIESTGFTSQVAVDIEQVPDDESNLHNEDDPILKAVAKYQNHTSILGIKELQIFCQHIKRKISQTLRTIAN